MSPPGVIVSAAADTALARLAERCLTVIGVPLLLACVGFVSAQLWNVRDRLATHDGELALRRAEFATLERRARDDSDAIRASLREAIERGTQARASADRVRDERDASHDRQIGELAGAVAAAREGMARFGAQLDAARGDLAEIKGLLQRPPAGPARAIDRMPPGAWSGTR